MATTDFRIQISTVLSTPAEPPLAAWPTTYAAPYVQFPKPTRANGYNRPAGIVGLPFCVFGRERISQTGLAYYNALFASGDAEYARVKARLYNSRTQTWNIYIGTLWRPEFRESASGMAYGFREFKATIVDLVKIVSWNQIVE